MNLLSGLLAGLIIGAVIMGVLVGGRVLTIGGADDNSKKKK